MKYKSELIRAMDWLATKEETVFLGQACKVSGHAISSTISEVPQEKRIELPVFEETQLGISTGLALEGYVPITMYPRFDFFILAINQFERTHETQVAGVRVRAPMIHIHTVAAGGGSILHFDGSRLRVGPDSAGAEVA